MKRLDWQGNEIEVPDGTTTCLRPFDSNTVHAVFAPFYEGTIQFLTQCGGRAVKAYGTVLTEVNCVQCLRVLQGLDPQTGEPPKLVIPR